MRYVKDMKNHELSLIDDKNKFFSIDYIRVIGVLLVILCHSVENGIYYFNIEYMNSVSDKSELFAHIIFTLGRLGVPLFVMISGFLLLPRSYNKEKIKYFWVNNFLKLFITFEIWVFIYRGFGILFLEWPFDFCTLMKEILLVRRVDLDHIWYIPMILGLYLFLPLVANSLKILDYKSIFILVFISSLFLFGVPTLNVFFLATGKEPVWYQIDLEFIGGIYGIYLIIGYLIRNHFFSRINNTLLLLLAIVNFIIIVLMQYWSYSKGFAYNV